jgi:peptide-methionine (S)-S-oxide reductase
METATFAAGCFWGVEATFQRVKGVASTEVGYTGGTLDDPTYEEVCSDTTGHAEAVRVTFDPGHLSYEDLLQIFWASHDPTSLNRQGPDSGSQYRSAIYYHDEAQREAATRSRAALQASERMERPVVTEICAASTFYRAEEYHQRYLERQGMLRCSV